MIVETVPVPVAGETSFEPAVQSLIQQAVSVAKSRGRTDIAESLSTQLAARHGDGATVVVVGETKRGKSSLLNALLGWSALPVEQDVATNVHIVLRYAAQTIALVHRVSAGGPQEIPLGEVAEWATVAGNPGNTKGVQGVEIGLDHPLLAQGLRLVDTPGVGGLSAAHREITLAALARADALVFVIDADAPLSRPEFAFLRQAARRIATVFFVLTKIDAYAEWEAILECDRKLLRMHAPELAPAPFYPVSSHEKADADASGDDDLGRESGVPALEAVLTERVAGRARLLSLANLVQTTREAVATLDAPERAAMEVAEDGPALEQALQATELRQREYAAQTEGWANTVTMDFQRRVRHPLDREFRRRLLELSVRYEARIRSPERRLETIPDDLHTELRAIAADLQTMLVAATAELVVDLADQFDLSSGSSVSDQLSAGGGSLEFAPLKPQDRQRGDDLSQKLRGLTLLFGGASSGRLLATLLPGGLLLGAGVGVLVGAVAWGTGEWLRRKLQDEQEAMAVLRRALDTARVEIEADLRDHLLDAQRLVQEEIRSRIEQRRRELAELGARHRASAQADRAGRKAAGVEARRRLAETETLRRSLRDVQVEMTL